MMLAIVKFQGLPERLNDSLMDTLGYIPSMKTFKEMFNNYKNSVKKSKRNFATEEIFSLQYDSLLSDLKESVWLTVEESDIPLLKKQFKVLEICK